MAQLFSNNADTQLSAPLTDVGTSASVADGSKMETPTGGDYELLTLISGTTVEIVRMTARTGNTITITRAQEGTAAIAWGTGTRIFAGVTAGTLDQAISSGIQNETAEVGSIAMNLGTGSLGAGTTHAFVFGDTAYADTTGQIAIGNGVYAETGASVSIGQWSGVVGGPGVAIGDTAFSRGNGVAIGPEAEVVSGATDAVSIGYLSVVRAGCVSGVAIGPRAVVALDSPGGIAIGGDATVSTLNDGAMAIGSTITRAKHALQIAALYTVPRGAGTEATAAWTMSAGAAVIMSEPLDLKTLLTHTIAIPAGLRFFVDEIGIVVISADTVTVQPTMRFGITATEAKFSAAALTTGLTAAHNRDRITALDSADGVTTLRSEVTVVATATALTGRVYWRGIAVTDNA